MLSYGAAGVRETRNSVHYTYWQFSQRAERSGTCLCGKRNRRSTTFTATTSPFNRDPETGLPRTAEQVQRRLRDKAAAWEPDHTCTKHEWACLSLPMVGGAGAHETVFTLGTRGPLLAARREGARLSGGTDDFRLALLDGRRLVGMTDANGKPLDWPQDAYVDECRLVADYLGLSYGGE